MTVRRPIGTAVGMLMIVLASVAGPSAALASHAGGLPGTKAPASTATTAGGLPGAYRNAGLPG